MSEQLVDVAAGSGEERGKVTVSLWRRMTVSFDMKFGLI